MATYYANNAGGGTGTSGSPFKVADFMALPPAPGDILILKSDTYQGAGSMITVPAVAGTAVNPITVQAEVDGGADIDGESVRDPMVVPSGANYWNFSGFNCHSSSQSASAVIRIRSNYCNYRRIIAWDAPVGYNAHCWDISGGSNFDPSGPHDNLIEDCGAFGRGRKLYSYFQTAGPNIFRRIWGRWEWSECTGPKAVIPTVYHSGALTVDNAICQWDRSALMPTSYNLLNNGTPFLHGSCAGGENADGSPYTDPPGSCWYFDPSTATPSTGFVNEPDGIVADNSASFAGSDSHDSGDVLCGILIYDTTSMIYDRGLSATTRAAFSITQYGGTTCKDIFVYLAPGVVDEQSGALPQGYVLQAPAAASNSSITGATSICGGFASDSITNRWTVTDPVGGSSSGGVTKVVQGTDLTALGSGNLYTGASGANRGAVLKYRYVNGILTGTLLWPWPMSARIKAATTQASSDGHGHQVMDIDASIQATFGTFPTAGGGVWFV